MSADSAERWMRAKEIFAIASEAADREAVMARLTGDDVKHIEEVRRLLAFHDAPNLMADSSPYPTAPRYRSGERLADRYLIQRFLASGGMGEVYEALDEASGHQVALKFITALAQRGASVEARLRREAKLLRRIDHPNVCRVIAMVESAGERFCVMELLKGETLASRLAKSGPLQPQEAGRIAVEICHALSAAHTAGVIHRDLKPGNIFLEQDRVVVIDFGLAAGAVENGSLTPPSAIIGTLAYMAPEQLEGEAATARTDIFALGVVFFEMLTGQKPYASKSPLRVAAQKAREAHANLRHGLPGIPAVWQEVIDRCLKASPAARYATAAEVGDALARKRPSLMFFVRRPRVALPIACASVVVAGWIGWSLSSRDRAPQDQAARLYEQARDGLLESAPHRSVQLLEKSVAADPGFLQASALLAVAYSESDQIEKARETVLRATAVADRRWILGRGERAALDAARATVMRDLEGALPPFERLVASSHGPERVQAMVSLGRTQAQAGKPDEAIATFEEVLQMSPSNPAARTSLASLLARRGNFRRAAEEFARAEQEFRREGNLEGLADLLLARAVSDRTRPIEGDRKDLDEVVAIAERIQSKYHFLQAQFGFLSLSIRSRDFARAAELMRRSVQEAQEHGFPTIAARAQSELGYLFVYQARHQEAIDPLQKALEMAERSKSLGLVASTRMRLGEALANLYRNEEAVSLMRPAIEWYRQGGHEERLPLMLIKWGTVQPFEQVETRTAIFEDALERAIRTGNEPYQALAMQRLASVHAARDLRKASDLFQRLLPLARKAGHHGAIAAAAAVQIRLGRNTAGEEMFREVERALESYPKGAAHDLVLSGLLGSQAEAAYIRGRCLDGLAYFRRNPRPTQLDRAREKRLAACAGRLTPRDLMWAKSRDRQELNELVSASEVALRTGDNATAQRLAGRADSEARRLRNVPLELESVLLLRAAEGTHRLSDRSLQLARQVGFDPPEELGGRSDLLAMWKAVR